MAANQEQQTELLLELTPFENLPPATFEASVADQMVLDALPQDVKDALARILAVYTSPVEEPLGDADYCDSCMEHDSALARVRDLHARLTTTVEALEAVLVRCHDLVDDAKPLLAEIAFTVE